MRFKGPGCSWSRLRWAAGAWARRRIDAVLTQIAALPGPVAALAPFLRALAAGTLALIPPDLPAPLPDFLAKLLEAVRQARS